MTGLSEGNFAPFVTGTTVDVYVRVDRAGVPGTPTSSLVPPTQVRGQPCTEGRSWS